jgi:glycosyltransferase involved in cell wall biosynthesis
MNRQTEEGTTCSIVVPVYRGAETLEPLVERLAQVLPAFAQAYEVILVNDDSPDNSWEIIERLVQRYTWVRGIRLMRNYGQHNATLCGVRAARYEITVTMDDDLQHPPEEISRLLEKLNEGYDVVYGAPRKPPQGLWRNWMTRTTKRLLAWVMKVPSVREISAFRAFRTQLRDAFVGFSSPTLTLDVLLSWGSSRFTYILVDIPSARHSNYNFSALAHAALLILTGYTTAPLRLASWLGLVMSMFGVAIFVYVLGIYFIAGSLPGFPFLASVISIFSGAQMLVLGIFGEYLARMFDRIMDRPPYVIAQQVGAEQ